MNIFKSILLGIIQGVTEFLPVSSSGHLAIFKRLFGADFCVGIQFDLMLHLGTLVALIIVFYQDIGHMIVEFFEIIKICFANTVIFFKRRKGDDRYTYFKVINSNYKKLDLMIIISSVPTAILGIVGKKMVGMASDLLWVVGICLMITAGILVFADSREMNTQKIKNSRYSDAYFVGIAQGIATLPGISRSGATIGAGMALGFNKKLAIKYSFLMSIPTILGAVILDIPDIGKEAFGSANMPGYILGAIAAGITGYFAIKYMLKLIKGKKYKGFAIYCLAMGVFAIILSFIKK